MMAAGEATVPRPLVTSIVPALVMALVIGLGGLPALRAADEFVVIVHPSVSGAKIRRADLASVFLRQALRWSAGGGMAVPVDQSGASAVRKAFSDGVLRRPVAQVVHYWQKQMFSSSALRPPPVKNSDAEVIAFVAKTPGAVGYVAATTSLPPEVRVLGLLD
jgi:ABC-type phosphate transport system substrate-binding protein